MAEPISQAPIAPSSPTDGMFTLEPVTFVIFGIVGIFALIYFIFWKGRKDAAAEAEKEDHFLQELNLMRMDCFHNASPRYYKSSWRTAKNAKINRIFEEGGDVHIMPLMGEKTYYMGHKEDKQGMVELAFTSRKKWGLIPVIDVMYAPAESVMFQPHDYSITVKAVSIDRFSTSQPFLPVYQTEGGSIFKDGFTMIGKIWEERLAAKLIQEQGDAALSLAERMPSLNPDVQWSQKAKPRDK